MNRVGLEDQYQRLNDLWEDVETVAKSYGIPQKVTYVSPDGTVVISWRWCKGNWRLCYVKDINTSVERITPILDSPIEIRTTYGAHVVAFLRQMKKASEEYSPYLENAINTLSKEIGDFVAETSSPKAE